MKNTATAPRARSAARRTCCTPRPDERAATVPAAIRGRIAWALSNEDALEPVPARVK